ncbi:MAG: VOC family protein [Thiobacillaceae bacterium]|jgi:predicted enzyme related to lactoylglutathione lyase
MDEQCNRHGAFSWCEQMTKDVAAAKAFYGKLFGWEMEDMPMPEMTYTVVKVRGNGIGGIMAIPPKPQGMPPMWGAYVTVDDVDLTAQAARQLGAKLLVPPQDVPDVGDPA